MTAFKKRVKAQVSAKPSPEPDTLQQQIAADFEDWFDLPAGSINALVVSYTEGYYDNVKVSLKHKGIPFKAEWDSDRYGHGRNKRRDGAWKVRTWRGYKDTEKVENASEA